MMHLGKSSLQVKFVCVGPVSGKTKRDCSHLVEFTLVTRGEAVSDVKTTAGVDVTFGWMVALVTFPTDVMFTLEKLNGLSNELEGRIKELDGITLEFNDEGTKELVTVKLLFVLLIVSTTELTNDVDVDISEVLFNTVVLGSRGVGDDTVRRLETELLVTMDDVTVPTKVAFGMMVTRLDEEVIEKVLVSNKIDEELETLLLVGKLV